VRIALIDENGAAGDALRELLAKNGYDVAEGPADEASSSSSSDGQEVVLRVASTSQSGILVPRQQPQSGVGGGNSDEDDARLERAKMESIARLAGGIAHDFNNILSVVSICTDEAFDALPAETEIHRECVRDIRLAIERGAALTRDLLAFSRRDVHEPRMTDINELVTDARLMMSRILGDDVALHLTLGANQSLVRVDPGQWMSVFVNLAVNARQAMPKGGALTVRTRDVVLDPALRGRDKPSGRYVELEISDTGCGIPDAIQSRIFDPFFTTKPIGQAHGLGLSVVHGIVETSRGFIEVHSDVDGDSPGTTFRLYIPVAPASVSEPPHSRTTEKSRDGSGGPSITLLFVEDEDALRRVGTKMLERAGYTVHQAASAEEALALMNGPLVAKIDLLVTDIVLPGMDGRRLAIQLQNNDPDLEVLYTSGYTDDDIVRFGVLRSEMSFLQKPYTTKMLIERVEEVLSKSARSRALAR